MKTIGTFDVSFLASYKTNAMILHLELFKLELVSILVKGCGATLKSQTTFPAMASPRHGNDALPLNPSHLTRLTETMTEANRQKCSKKNKACPKHGSVVKLPDVRISMHPSHTFFQPRCCIRSGGCPQCCSWQCIYQCILYIRSILTGSRIYSLLYIYICIYIYIYMIHHSHLLSRWGLWLLLRHLLNSKAFSKGIRCWWKEVAQVFWAGKLAGGVTLENEMVSRNRPSINSVVSQKTFLELEWSTTRTFCPDGDSDFCCDTFWIQKPFQKA